MDFTYLSAYVIYILIYIFIKCSWDFCCKINVPVLPTEIFRWKWITHCQKRGVKNYAVCSFNSSHYVKKQFWVSSKIFFYVKWDKLKWETTVLKLNELICSLFFQDLNSEAYLFTIVYYTIINYILVQNPYLTAAAGQLFSKTEIWTYKVNWFWPI